MTTPSAPLRPPPGIARPNWGAEALWEALVPLLPGLSIEVVERLDSTNSELIERLRRASRVQDGGREGRSGDLHPQLLVATHQTAGRGRLGRRWHATPGASLTFSLALPLERADWSGLSLAVGLAVIEALDPTGTLLGLKWPNDLMLRPQPGDPEAAQHPLGRKLGGILIESVTVGARRVAVIGIGINVDAQRSAEADYGTASLTEFHPEASAQDTLARIAPSLAAALVGFDAAGFGPRAAAYTARDVLRGHLVRTTDPALPEGIAEGVDDDGALMIRAAGASHRVVSGEVSIRPVAGA